MSLSCRDISRLGRAVQPNKKGQGRNFHHIHQEIVREITATRDSANTCSLSLTMVHTHRTYWGRPTIWGIPIACRGPPNNIITYSLSAQIHGEIDCWIHNRFSALQQGGQWFALVFLHSCTLSHALLHVYVWLLLRVIPFTHSFLEGISL